MNFLNALAPEVILTAVACLLFVLAALPGVAVRKASPWISVAGVIAALYVILSRVYDDYRPVGVDQTLILSNFAAYVKAVALCIGLLLILLNWPTNSDASGNNCLSLEREAPEYFGLMLLSFTGIMLVASANDLILFFLAIELSAIPTYIMVSMSRPLAVAQEATLKYFFLGAFSAALTLFGLSFLYGATGSITLTGISGLLPTPAEGGMSAWLALGGVLLIVGLAFKMAAFPLHFYAPDVYTGAATPLTALLSFVPKIAGVVGLVRVLYAIAGEHGQNLPETFQTTLWILAVATMTIGNVLGLMQQNIKRMMACSSIAHSGYMLVGVAVLFGSVLSTPRDLALQGILFYVTAYGLMNAGVFAVLMMLPARPDPFLYGGKVPPATTAETFADLAGTARTRVSLGLLMAACCFSLIGIPLTIGFFGKFYLIRPALHGGFYWLTIITVLNAAISAGYYLRIIVVMFLKEPRPESLAPATEQASVDACGPACMKTVPLMLAAILSAGGSIFLGTFLPATTTLRSLTMSSGDIMPYRNPEDHQQSASLPAPFNADGLQR